MNGGAGEDSEKEEEREGGGGSAQGTKGCWGLKAAASAYLWISAKFVLDLARERFACARHAPFGDIPFERFVELASNYW